MTYKAPINDIKFTFDYMTEFTDLVKAGTFTDLSDDLIDAVLNEAAKFAENEIAPLNRVGDREGATLIAHDNDYNEVKTATGWGKAYKNWCDAGWASLPHNPEYGGQGLPGILGVATTEMWNAASMAFGIGPVLTQGAADTIENLGTEAQKTTYLAQIVSGNWTATMNLTEPDVGSDLGNLACKAVRDDANNDEGEFKIFGTKIFITYGEHDLAENIIHLVLARIENAPKGVKGLSLFIVPKYLINKDGSLGQRNDLEAIRLEEKMGIHASPTCTMEFGANNGAKAYLIGEENKGINAMFMLMNNARLMVGTQGVAIGDRAYQHALHYANERTQGRRADTPKGKMTLIKNHPDVRHMLLKQRCYTLASRALCYDTALNLDLSQKRGDEAQLNADFLTPIAKGFATDMGVEVASLGVQIYGGMGFIEEAGAAQHYRDARIASIYEGTNGIQAMDLVGRKLKMDNGATAIRYLDTVLNTADDIMHTDLPFGKTAYRLKDAAEAAREATLWLLATEDSDLPLAAATNYLRLMGLVLGGHYIAKGAFKARGSIPNDSEYLYLARFFAECLLPEVLALKKIVIDGSETLLQAPNGMFDL